jgi:hypothetical protein
MSDPFHTVDAPELPPVEEAQYLALGAATDVDALLELVKAVPETNAYHVDLLDVAARLRRIAYALGEVGGAPPVVVTPVEIGGVH